MEIIGLDLGMFAFCVFSFLAGLYIFSYGLCSKTDTKQFKSACIVLGLAYMGVTISTVVQLNGVKSYFGDAPAVTSEDGDV